MTAVIRMFMLLFQFPLGGITGPSSSGPAFVNSVSAATSSSGGTTAAVNMTGATLIAGYTSSWLGGTIANPTSSPANTFTVGTCFQDGGGGSGAEICPFYLYSPSVSSSMTFSTTSSYASICAMGFKSTAGSTIDQTNHGTSSTGVTSLASGSVTPLHNKEVVVTGVGMASGESGGITGPGGAYTLREHRDFSSGNNYGIGCSSSIQSTATATNPSTSWTGAATAAGVTMSFQ